MIDQCDGRQGQTEATNHNVQVDRATGSICSRGCEAKINERVGSGGDGAHTVQCHTLSGSDSLGQARPRARARAATVKQSRALREAPKGLLVREGAPPRASLVIVASVRASELEAHS